MQLLKRSIFVLVLICTINPSFSQLIISPMTTPQALAEKLVGNGVTISNVTLTGSTNSAGFFVNHAGTQIGLDSGIVLSSGRVLTSGSSNGMNGSQFSLASTPMNTPGDADLTNLSGQVTKDAIILEFDFVPLGDSVKFTYVFSSDEYPTFTCSQFNDVFAFFITGPGISGSQNLALVPGTNIPVAINTINSGIPGGGYQLSTCQAMGPGSPFTQYYINNAGNPYFTHNGHTTVLVAKSGVQPCQTYHLKMAIADAFDGSYDSGVFLGAESLQSDPVQIINTMPVFNGLPYLVEGCQPGSLKIVRSRKAPAAQPVNLSFSGTAINGSDIQTMPAVAIIPANDSVVEIPIVPIVDNIPEGTEVFKIYISNGCILNNLYLDSITIQLREYDTLAVSPKYSALCKNTSVQLNAGGNYTSYQWSPATGLNNPAIKNPVVSPTGNTTYIVSAQLGDCHAKDSVRVDLKSLEFISKKDINCANGTTGQIKVGGGYEWTSPVQYAINSGGFGPDSTFNNLATGNYIVKVKDASGCIDSMAVSLVQAFPNLLLDDSTVTAACNGANGQIILSATGGLQPYKYSVDAGAYSPAYNFNVMGGSHMVHVKDSNGCITTQNVVITNDPPINVSTSANAASCSGSPDGVIFVAAQGGSGQYTYSIDGINFQAVNQFNVNVGNLTVTVKDNKGCTGTQAVMIPLNQTIFVNVGNDTAICEGSSIQFNTVANAASFIWSASGSLSNLNVPNPVATPHTTTTYYVMAIKDICTVYDTITVTVNPAPLANAGPDSSICLGKTIMLNGSGGTAYEWTPASAVSDPHSSNPTVTPTQSTRYFLKVYNSYGCASLKQDTVLVSLVPSVQAFAGVDTSITVGQPLQLHGLDLNNSGATMFEWTPAYGLNDPNIPNPVATLDKDMTYTLRLTTPEGCTGSDIITVKVFKGPEIFVPTGFTPNGDGLNDLLRSFPVGMKEFHYFRVFNRWGQMIFSSAAETRGWDGKINGKLQPTGTYIWMVEAVDFRGNVIVRKGATTLIR